MNLNVSSTDSADENLVSTERNSCFSSISFSDEKPSQALLAKKIKSLLKASSTMIPPNQDQIVKSQEILKSEDDHSGVQKARKIKFSPLKNPTSISVVAKEDSVTMEIFSDLSDDDNGEENSIMENRIENPALNEKSRMNNVPKLTRKKNARLFQRKRLVRMFPEDHFLESKRIKTGSEKPLKRFDKIQPG